MKINKRYSTKAQLGKKLMELHIYRLSRGDVPSFGRMFLKLKYTDITKNTYIRSRTITEIKAREKCGLLAVPRTVPGSRDVLPLTLRMSVLVYSRLKRVRAATVHVKCLEI